MFKQWSEKFRKGKDCIQFMMNQLYLHEANYKETLCKIIDISAFLEERILLS